MGTANQNQQKTHASPPDFASLKKELKGAPAVNMSGRERIGKERELERAIIEARSLAGQDSEKAKARRLTLRNRIDQLREMLGVVA